MFSSVISASHVFCTAGRELFVIALAGGYPDKHVELRPEIKYVANMHGDEVRAISTLDAYCYTL